MELQQHQYRESLSSLETPRVLWIMVPHTVVDSVLSELKPLLDEGDIIIEAGNSHYKESIRRYEELKENGISYMDAGTSGGMEGARQGACYMIGGDQEAGKWLNRFSMIQLLKMAIYMQGKLVADIS